MVNLLEADDSRAQHTIYYDYDKAGQLTLENRRQATPHRPRKAEEHGWHTLSVHKAGAHAVGAEHWKSRIPCAKNLGVSDASRPPWAAPKVSHPAVFAPAGPAQAEASTVAVRALPHRRRTEGAEVPSLHRLRVVLAVFATFAVNPSFTPSRLVGRWFEGPELEAGEFDEVVGPEAPAEDGPAETHVH